MNDRERHYFESMLDLLEPMENEHRVSALIEVNGVIQKISTQRLRANEEVQEISSFVERFKEAGEINFQQSTIYIHGNSHVFTLINFLINKNPKTIVYKKKLVKLKNSTIELIRIHKRAKKRGIEIKEI
ncbi:MAG TPA: hypothetical protein PKL20_00680 [Candidatus Paceibacterota bacterium]|nr:hypothetical protein [Candidatus Paceibacterota bacterium]